MNTRVWMIGWVLLILPVGRASADGQACRPCGPDSIKGPLRLLIPQGSAGADFRPACRAHDACYGTPGTDRAECDCQFLQDLFAQCQTARNPRRCRRSARRMYRMVRRHGERAFDKAQHKHAADAPRLCQRLADH